MDAKYLLGIQEIDVQHTGIFAAMEPLQGAASRGVHALPLAAALFKLRQVLVAHFDYEESFMASIGCPDLEEHKREHAELLTLLDDCIGVGTHAADDGDMGHTIGSRISEHMLEYDVTMGRVVEELVSRLRRHETEERH